VQETEMSRASKKYIEDLSAGIRAGSERKIFAGPILDTHGEMRVLSGEFLSRQALQSLDWLTLGIRLTGE